MTSVSDYRIAGASPRIVIRPQTELEVAQALREAAVANHGVVPWGAGTKQQAGNSPRAYHVALDLTALHGVVEYEPADLVATVRAGTPLSVIQKQLAPAGQFLALDPPYAETATVGGTLAANASGPSRLLYGTARDLVLGMRVATVDGHVVKSGGKVVKNVVGYDLNKMHIGGLGTLGVMVEVTFKVHPLPEAEASVAATFDRLQEAFACASQLFRSVLYPRAVSVTNMTVAGADGDPSTGNGQSGHSGHSGQWHVVTWASGSPATVERQVRDASRWCGDGGAASVSRLDGDAHRVTWDAIREFGRGDIGGGALVKLTSLPSDVPGVVERVFRLSSDEGLATPQVVCHPGNGVCYTLLPESRGGLLAGLAAEAHRRGGSSVVERADDAVRAGLDVWGPVRDDLPLMQALKAQFDPRATLNPGRFVGGI